MNDFRVLRRIRSVARGVASAGRWALPLACVLALSTTLTAAMERATVRNLDDVPSGPPTSEVRTMRAENALDIGHSGAQWMKLVYRDAYGHQTGLDCLVTSDNVSSGDTLIFEDPEELFRLAPEMCLSTRALPVSVHRSQV